MARKLLIVEDETTLRESLSRVFLREGYDVMGVGSAEAALEILAGDVFDLMITDIILTGIDGIELLRRAKERYPDLLVVIMTAYASVETAVNALRCGAYDYVMKPVIHEEIKRIVSNALTQSSLRSENALLRRQIEKTYNFSNIVGESRAIKDVVEEIRRIADARTSVLFTGETGTGKELFARATHHASRPDGPFVPINCSAIPEHLLESELFGYVKGAFTGAVGSKKGLFDEADEGSLFLDEIGDISFALQAKLLRVLEDQEVRPLGGTQSRKVNVRILAATNTDIEKAVEDGRFRQDLYYRINVITIPLPPLREREGDVELLARHFIGKFATDMAKPVKDVSPEACGVLSAYSWPGNVRELLNVVERAVLIASGDTILPEHLPSGVFRRNTFVRNALQERLSIDDYTKLFILEHQDRCSEQQLADFLGITRKTLWEKRKKWNIRRAGTPDILV